METSAFGSGNRLTYTEIHATILGLVVGFLVGHAVALGYTDLAVATGAAFVAVAMGVRFRREIPVARRTVRREPWYALAAFLIAGALRTIV